MNKKILFALAGLLLVGCTEKTNIDNINNTNINNTTTNSGENNNNNNNNTSTNTGENGNTNEGENNNQGNNTNEGGENNNNNNNNGNNNQQKITYEDVSINDTFVAPGFPNDYMYCEDDTINKVFLSPVSLNSVLATDFNSVSKHYYEGEFANKLPSPKETVSNFDELAYIFEYCGFYGIETYNVKFASTYIVQDAGKEFNKAFWYSRMLGQTGGYSFSNGENSSYNLSFAFNEFADTAIAKKARTKAPVNPYKITATEGKLIDDIPYTPTKGNLDVHNSDQLIYAIENGYKPVMEKDSRVDLVYRKACYLLTHTIKDNMNDLQKIYVINDTIFNLADYDSNGEFIAYGVLGDSELEAKFPFALASTFVSFFADGPLLYGLATCAGFAKAQSLMFALLNINHMRVTAGNVVLEDTIYSKTVEEGYWYHEYTYYIDSNNKYYVCDITYSVGGNEVNIEGEIYRFPIRPLCTAFTREYWGETYDREDILNDVVKVYHHSSLGTEDLKYYESVLINGTTNIYVSKDVDTFRTAMNAGKQAISDYKTKNNISTPQLYLLSFATDTEYGDRSIFLQAANMIADEYADVVVWYWAYYAYGAHFILYM